MAKDDDQTMVEDESITVICTLTAKGTTRVQAIDAEGRPFHVGFQKKSPRNDFLTDKQINEIWASERKRGRA